MKPKRTLTEKQKETLAKGRANLKAKKEQQLKDTQAYKDQMVILRAEQLKQHKKVLKKQVGLPPVSDNEDEEVEVVYKAPKQKKKKIVYIESESESEEEVVYKKTPKKRKIVFV